MSLSRKANPKDPASTATIRDVLEQVYAASGNLPDELKNETPLPECCKWLWGIFIELNLERQSNGYGPLPITSTQIKDFCYLNGYNLSRIEFQLLRAIETTYLIEITKDAKKEA